MMNKGRNNRAGSRTRVKEIRKWLFTQIGYYCPDMDRIFPESIYGPEIGLDDIDEMEIHADIEDRFGVAVPDYYIGRGMTVQDVIDRITDIIKNNER